MSGRVGLNSGAKPWLRSDSCSLFGVARVSALPPPLMRSEPILRRHTGLRRLPRLRTPQSRWPAQPAIRLLGFAPPTRLDSSAHRSSAHSEQRHFSVGWFPHQAICRVVLTILRQELECFPIPNFDLQCNWAETSGTLNFEPEYS